MKTIIETIVEVIESFSAALCFGGLLAMVFSILAVIRGGIVSTNWNMSPLDIFYCAGILSVFSGLLWLFIANMRKS